MYKLLIALLLIPALASAQIVGSPGQISGSTVSYSGSGGNPNALLNYNNLADVNNVDSARSNLGLGTISTMSATAYPSVFTSTGTSGAISFSTGTLNIPLYQGKITLTTTGAGAATFDGTTLNIPTSTSGGGGGGGGSTVPVSLAYTNPLPLAPVGSSYYAKCILYGALEIYFSAGGTDGQEVQLMLIPTGGDAALTLTGIQIPSESTYTNPKTLTNNLLYIVKFKYSQDAGEWMLVSLVGGYSGY
jgi:hypothetical protein